jgi:hypothetical protein
LQARSHKVSGLFIYLLLILLPEEYEFEMFKIGFIKILIKIILMYKKVWLGENK